MKAAEGDRRRDVEHLHLERPLVLFDLETTGTDPSRDKVVEIAILRLDPDGGRLGRTRRINPERPIPAEATAVHGIRDEDVRDEPPFRRIARGLLELLAGADLAGFNVRRFDVPLLDREFRECGLDLELAERRIVDAMTIFHRQEPRDLSAAVRFYLGREHEGAHGAEADLNATAEVLDAQLERYPDLPRSVEELDAWSRPRRDAVDGQGKFVRRHDEIVFGFGKHRGRSLAEVAREAPDYLEWVVSSDFPEDAKEIVRHALKGE
jgi:DNA polymerase-3 subunit epsilon